MSAPLTVTVLYGPGDWLSHFCIGESELELVVVEVVVVVVVVLPVLLLGASILAQPAIEPRANDMAMTVLKLLINLPDIDYSNQ